MTAPLRPGVIAAAGLAAAVLLAGCAGRTGGGTFEAASGAAPTRRFTTIGTLATSATRMDIRMMVQVRQQLQKAGVNAVKVSGRFGTVADAVVQLCASGAEQPVDGILTVAYNELVLFDCDTHKPAYQIHSGSLGLPNLTSRLIRYLKAKPES